MPASWTRGFRAWLTLLARGEQLGLGTRESLASLLRQLAFAEAELQRLDRALARLVDAPRYRARVRAMTQLSGVGVLTALVFLTEVGDLSRFGNRRQLSAYLGLAPRSQESGERQNRKGHITRQGPSRVRKVLCQATWARVRCDETERAVYERIAMKNPQHKKIAVVASMRRLAVRLWHLGRDALTSVAVASTKPASRKRSSSCKEPSSKRPPSHHEESRPPRGSKTSVARRETRCASAG